MDLVEKSTSRSLGGLGSCGGARPLSEISSKAEAAGWQKKLRHRPSRDEIDKDSG